MDSQTEETQDTYREAMCVTIKEWPLDSTRMSNRPTEAVISPRPRAKRRAVLIVLRHLLLSFLADFLTRRPHNVSHLLQFNKDTREVQKKKKKSSHHRYWGTETCVAMGSCLQKGNCLLYRFMTVSTLQCFGKDLGTDGGSVSSCGWEDPIRDDWAGLTLGSGTKIEKSHRGPIGSSAHSPSFFLFPSSLPLSFSVLYLREAEVRGMSPHKQYTHTVSVIFFSFCLFRFN